MYSYLIYIHVFPTVCVRQHNDGPDIRLLATCTREGVTIKYSGN